RRPWVVGNSVVLHDFCSRRGVTCRFPILRGVGSFGGITMGSTASEAYAAVASLASMGSAAAS
ncbi:unnamed protein product, partial [Urochloa humidicola]